MTKRVGILGLLVAAAVGFLHPAVASAQDRYYSGRYAQREYRDRDWRGDNRFREHEWREARERQAWRAREWRERERLDHGYRAGYYDGYRAPAVGFGFNVYPR
jgi:hypothetical protein